MSRLAPIIERLMLDLDDTYYHLRDAGRDTSIIDAMVKRCERLTDKWQRQHDCPTCTGVVNVLTARGRMTEHDQECPSC